MSNDLSYTSVFSDDLEDLEIRNLQIIGRAALLEAATRMEQEANEAPDPVDLGALQKFMRQAERIQRRDRLIGGLKAAYQIVSKVAVVALVLLIGGITVAVNVEAIRVPLLNWLIEVQETHTVIHFTDQSNGLPVVSFGYLPEGYRLESTEGTTSAQTYKLNDADNHLIILVQSDLSVGISLDTEDASISNVVLANGQLAFLVEKEEFTQLIWTLDNCSFQISGTILSDEIIKIAESLKLLK